MEKVKLLPDTLLGLTQAEGRKAPRSEVVLGWGLTLVGVLWRSSEGSTASGSTLLGSSTLVSSSVGKSSVGGGGVTLAPIVSSMPASRESLRLVSSLVLLLRVITDSGLSGLALLLGIRDLPGGGEEEGLPS